MTIGLMAFLNLSIEKASHRLWPLRVWRHLPEAVSQTLTVRSYDADASRLSSCEKATDQTRPLWPSSVWRHELQSSCIAGFVIIHSGSSCLNSSLIRLRAGLNTSADVYTWRGVFSITHLW